MNKKILKIIFGEAVDGQNCNAYIALGDLLRKCQKDPMETIRVSTLADVLDELSDKWEKEIDEVINSEEY